MGGSDGENLPPESDLTEGRGRRKRTVLLGVGLAGFAAAWGRYRPSLARVEGASMRPALEPGTVLLVLRLRPRVGSIAVAEHPSGAMEIVKRITAGPGDTVTFGPEELVLSDDEWWLEGDAGEWSTDSRRFGPLPRAAIKGRFFELPRRARTDGAPG